MYHPLHNEIAIAMKTLETVAADRNREDVKESRREYAVLLNELQGGLNRTRSSSLTKAASTFG